MPGRGLWLVRFDVARLESSASSHRSPALPARRLRRGIFPSGVSSKAGESDS